MNNLSSIFRRFFVETYFIQLNALNQYFTCIKYTIIFKALLQASVIADPWPLGVGQVWQFSFSTWRSRHRDIEWLAQSNLGLQPNQAALFSLRFPHLRLHLKNDSHLVKTLGIQYALKDSAVREGSLGPSLGWRGWWVLRVVPWRLCC